MGTSITIATPCYNEAASLPSYFDAITYVLGQLERAGWQTRLLLIDDGSRDGTLRLLEQYAQRRPGVTTVRHPENLGYGAAIKTALAVSQTDWIVFVDADSNYDQRLILDLMQRVGPDVDLVNVSILAPGGAVGYPWYRLLLSSTASWIYRLTFPRLTREVYTMTCGFRVYRKELVPRVFPRADDFVATSEILLRALRAGARVLEFPATNVKREHGVSKLRVLRVSAGHLLLALKTRLGFLGPPPEVKTHLDRIGVTRQPGARCTG